MPKLPKVSEQFLQMAEPIGRSLRLDANETTILARSLEQSAVRAVDHLYPSLKVRQLAPMLEGIDPGADTYTWHEVEQTGQAEIITNYADDLPSVGQFLTENIGRIRSIGTSFEYSTQDLRRAAKASAMGLHPVLDPQPTQVADEFIERKIDQLGATGDADHNLPGMLNNASVEGLGIGTASGLWLSGGATPTDIVEDIRGALNKVAVQSDGNYQVTTVVLPIAQLRYIATTPLLGTGDNRITILQDVIDSERAATGRTLQFMDWHKTVGAGAGAVDRAMFYQQTSDVLALVNPLRSTFTEPQPQGLHWSVPVESRCGGVDVFKPLACHYLDGI